jgi:hypothetical protein
VLPALTKKSFSNNNHVDDKKRSIKSKFVGFDDLPTSSSSSIRALDGKKGKTRDDEFRLIILDANDMSNAIDEELSKLITIEYGSGKVSELFLQCSVLVEKVAKLLKIVKEPLSTGRF